LFLRTSSASEIEEEPFEYNTDFCAEVRDFSIYQVPVISVITRFLSRARKDTPRTAKSLRHIVADVGNTRRERIVVS